MAQIIQYFVDDTSPTVSYLPFRDTFSTPNLTAGWNPYFDDSGFPTTLGEVGSGTSYHATSYANASLSITWRGTGIQLLGFTNNSNYDIFLDGTSQNSFNADSISNVLASFRNLTDAIHNISLASRTRANAPPESVVFFDKALIISAANVSSSSLFMEHSVNKNNISYIGEWSFVNESGNAVHRSNTRGDTVQTRFNGASFLLSGATSPQCGTYSVVLDNVKTTFSARSSFTQRDTLLFFVNGLDPETPHEIQVINEDGGELSLKVDGFKAFTAEPPISSTPTPTQSLGMGQGGVPKGTIAALVLAGLLTFLFFSAILYYIFVARPRGKQRAQHARSRRTMRKNQDVEDPTGQILDIGPESGGGREGSQQSKLSGFSRWKREVEGNFGSRTIGIVFRHSESANENGAYPDVSQDGKTPSTSRRHKGKKVKSRHSQPESSPSFTLDLQLRSKESYDSQKDPDISEDSLMPMPDVPPSITSGLSELSYISAVPPVPRLPPEYSNPNVSPGTHQSVPRSVSLPPPSPKSNHGRNGSGGYLLTYGEPTPGLPGEQMPGDPDYEPVTVSLELPSEQPDYPPTPTTRGDQGSARYSSEDTTSFIGPATTRIAIRSLSPRMSESGEQHLSRAASAGHENPPPRVSQSSEGPGGTVSLHLHPLEVKTSGLSIMEPHKSFLEVPSPVDQHPPELSNMSPQDGVRASFLDVRAASPFQVDFGGANSRRSSRRTEAVPPESSGITEPPGTGAKRRSSTLHIGSPSGPRTLGASLSRKEPTSFLDFSASSDSSNRTQSIAPTENFSQDRRLSGRQLATRWSNPLETTIDLEESSEVSDLPPIHSPPLSTKPVLPQLIPPSIISSSVDDPDNMGSGNPHTHPIPSFPSPTESVPASVATEIQFRRGSLMDDARSHISNFSMPPSYPPLPPPLPSTREQSEPGTPGQSPVPSSYIVQRTLGKSVSTPSPSGPRTRYQ